MESTEWIDRGAIRSDAPWQPSNLITTVGSLDHPASGLTSLSCDDAAKKQEPEVPFLFPYLSMRLNPRNHGDFCWFSKVHHLAQSSDWGHVIRRIFLCPFVPMTHTHTHTRAHTHTHTHTHTTHTHTHTHTQHTHNGKCGPESSSLPREYIYIYIYIYWK